MTIITLLEVIVINGKTALFEAEPYIAFLRRFYQILPSFHFFGFCINNFFLQSKVVSLASIPQLG
jgi:hypothetical protein